MSNMVDTKSIPEEIAEKFEKLRSEIVWLHGRWIIFEQLYGTSPERVELLNEIACTYFRIMQDILLDDILINIGRLTDEPKKGKNQNLSIGQITFGLDKEKYPELATRLDAKLEDIKNHSAEIRLYRNKKLAHHDIDVAFKKVEHSPSVTFGSIRRTLEAIRNFVNEGVLYFKDSEMTYEAFTMSEDGQTIINCLKKTIS